MINSIEHQTTLQTDKTPSVLNLLRCKCPRCRQGNMFVEKNPYSLAHTMQMNSECPVCGQPFDIEVGFYYGSFLISYTLSVLLCAVTFIAWWTFIGFHEAEHSLIAWLVINSILLVALQPVLMRLARTIWLAFFVRYDKAWRIHPPKPLERFNKDQMNNW